MIELWHQRSFRNAFLRRGVASWVGVRFMLALGKTSDPNLVGEALALVFVGLLVAYDARRRNEDLFLANLGIPVWAIGVLGAVGGLPLECLVP